MRILKKEVDSYRRTLEGSKKRTQTFHFEDRVNESIEERRSSAVRNESRVESKLKRKLKTQQSVNENSEDLNDLLHQKVEKDYLKIKSLANEKNKMRELVDNLKGQLAEKDKENAMLREKIGELRRNNQLLQTQAMANKSEPDVFEAKNRKEKENSSNYPKGIKSHKNLKGREPQTEPKRRLWKN